MNIKIENYTAIQHPCMVSSVEKPRGGCIMFIKDQLLKYVESVDTNFNDSIIVYLSTNIIICDPTTANILTINCTFMKL